MPTQILMSIPKRVAGLVPALRGRFKVTFSWSSRGEFNQSHLYVSSKKHLDAEIVDAIQEYSRGFIDASRLLQTKKRNAEKRR